MYVNQLKTYFPMLREREELLAEIRENPELSAIYDRWSRERREEFLNFCCGIQGIRVLYDSFFKETLNPEYDPSRLEDFLSTVLGRKVRIVKVLPNDSTRIADETSLLITDIVVELEDGSLANVEIQKIGYMFPGARCACYLSDLLLRQYKRVRDQKGDKFSYRDIRNVYLIVIYEKSPAEFKALPEVYYHNSKQVFNSGLKLDMLQEYFMINLDIFKACMQNKNIENNLDAWLTFLCDDRPEKIVELIQTYPKFRAMYQTLYDMCQNTEGVMRMFSKELLELDRNTVQYMIEEQQQKLDQKDRELSQKDRELSQKDQELNQKDQELSQKDRELSQKDQELNRKDQKLSSLQSEIDCLKKMLEEATRNVSNPEM